MIETLYDLSHTAEILSPSENVTFIDSVVPWCLQLMEQVSIRFVSMSLDQRIRIGILNVLKSLCSFVEPMKPHLKELMDLLLLVLREDNEENGIMAVHMVIELNKAHRVALEPYAQPLVDYVLSAFESFSEICDAAFDMAKREEKSGNGRRNTKTEIQILKANSSFKVLIECPVMIVLHFQMHRRLVADNIAKFAPHVINALSVEVDPPAV